MLLLELAKIHRERRDQLAQREFTAAYLPAPPITRTDKEAPQQSDRLLSNEPLRPRARKPGAQTRMIARAVACHHGVSHSKVVRVEVTTKMGNQIQ